MNKKNDITLRKKVVGITLLIALIFALFPEVLTSIGALVTNSSQLCSKTPYYPKCHCLPGFQKVSDGMLKFDCINQISYNNYTFPLSTWNQVYSYAEDKMGQGIKCSNDLFFRDFRIGDLQKNQDGMTGTPVYDQSNLVGHSVQVLCDKITEFDASGKPVSGEVAWSFQFDPNDGWIYQRTCNSKYILKCPTNILFTLKE